MILSRLTVTVLVTIALSTACSGLDRAVPFHQIRAGVVAGTMVSQGETFGPIETIVAGDQVDSAIPERLYRAKPRRVLAVRGQVVPETYFILMEHVNLILEVTGPTQVLTWGQEWKRADQLTTEDILIGHLFGQAQVVSIERRAGPTRVYWLDVEEWEMFRIGRLWFPVRE